MQKLKVGIIGATGMVGQRFIMLLNEHPYFEINALVASPRSAGQKYGKAVLGRWKMTDPCPERILNMEVISSEEVERVGSMVDFVFCAVSLNKEETKALEEKRERLLTRLQKAVRPDSLSVEDNLALIAVVGRGMVRSKGAAARVFDAISGADVNIKMIDQGSSEINIIIGVEEQDFETTLRAIYNKFAGNN